MRGRPRTLAVSAVCWEYTRALLGVVQLIGLNITGGYTSAVGAGVRVIGGTVTIKSSSIYGNTAGYNGGGVHVQSAIVSILNSELADLHQLSFWL
jgi:hypothetical protein